MRVTRFSTVAVIVIAAAIAVAAEVRQAAPKLIVVKPTDLKWGPAPPVLPAGAQMAVVDGDPAKAGLFTIRLKLPDGYVIPPHTHPTVENVVVVSGTLRIAMGTVRNDAEMQQLPVGAFTGIPKARAHYAAAKGETIIQIYGEGPFVLEHVNPSGKPAP